MTKRIRVAIFDSYSLFRRGVVDAFGGTCLLAVAEDETMDHAYNLIMESKPDIVLFDIRAVGAEVAKIASLLKSFPRSRFVVFTASDEIEHIEEVWRLGVHGCVLKGVSAGELVRALEGVHDGKPYISGTLAKMLLKTDKQVKVLPARNNFSTLTARDKQILGLLVEGLTNQEIAMCLGLTAKIVKRHLSSVFRKLRVSNRVQAALHAKKHAGELGL